ncbi:MAG: YdcF family protein [Phormidesmis sp.]
MSKLLSVRYAVLGLLLAITLYFVSMPIKLAIARQQAPVPQAIFTLGGGSDREQFTANFARQHPELDIWISTGVSPQLATDIFREAGIPISRLHLDYRAVDTVTNFTTMVQVFQQQKIQHVYLLTSDFHMKRAQAIAFLVLGSRGIAYTPISAPSGQPLESRLRVLRDRLRAILWLATGKTGAGIGLILSTLRLRQSQVRRR